MTTRIAYSDILDLKAGTQSVEFRLFRKENEFELPDTKTQIILHLLKIKENEFEIVSIPKSYSKGAFNQKMQNDEQYDYLAYYDFETWERRDAFIEILNDNNFNGKIIKLKPSIY